MRKLNVELYSIGEAYEIFIDIYYYGIANDSLKSVENLASAKNTLLKLGDVIDFKKRENTENYECTLKVKDEVTILQCAKGVAKGLLAVAPEQNSDFPFICHHPFTNTTGVAVMKDGKSLLLDISKNDEFEEWQKIMSYNIDNECKSVIDIAFFMNNAYRLTFMCFAKKYISCQDMGTMLNYFYSNVEYPNLDKNVTRKELLSMFRYADKKALMSEDELEKYNSFEDEVTIYRGVTPINKHIKTAISWTLDKSVAQKFSERFKVDNDENYGEVWEKKVPKERIICYWDSGEKEVIVDLYKR